jgi:hypothetical protein
MKKLKIWWRRTKWNHRRRMSWVPLHNWETEQYLRTSNVSQADFWGGVADQIRENKHKTND